MTRRLTSALAFAMLLVLGMGASAWAQEPKTIKPGMTEAEVRATWGEPLTARSAGTMKYLYYRNDCLRRCGTYDVVFLEGGQVVDAIVRAKGRRYDGVSSSPEDRQPRPTIVNSP